MMYLSILLDIVLEESSFKITSIKNFSFLLICDPILVDRGQGPSGCISAVPAAYCSDGEISVNNTSNKLHLTSKLFASEPLWNSHVD